MSEQQPRRVYSSSQWAADFERAHILNLPLGAVDTKARGLLLLAQNEEEPESDLTRAVEHRQQVREVRS